MSLGDVSVLTPSAPKKNKVTWLSLLQGLGMLLVVIGHSWVTSLPDPEHPVVSSVIGTIYQFHMPLFFAISGYLFWMTRIEKAWSFNSMISDKAFRLIWPFFVFTLFTYGLKLILPALVKRKVGDGLWGILEGIIYPTQNPLGEMWFVVTLFWMFFLFPLMKFCRNHLIALFLLFLVSVFSMRFSGGAPKVFAITKTIYYLPYFLLGALFSKSGVFNDLSERGNRLAFGIRNEFALAGAAVLIGIIEFAPVESWWIGFLLVIIWIFFCFSFSVWIAEKMPNLFGSFRDWTYQIFLLGIFFQIFMRTLYKRFGFGYDVFLVMDILLGLYAPVLIARAIKKTGNKFVASVLGL